MKDAIIWTVIGMVLGVIIGGSAYVSLFQQIDSQKQFIFGTSSYICTATNTLTEDKK